MGKNVSLNGRGGLCEWPEEPIKWIFNERKPGSMEIVSDGGDILYNGGLTGNQVTIEIFD